MPARTFYRGTLMSDPSDTNGGYPLGYGGTNAIVTSIVLCNTHSTVTINATLLLSYYISSGDTKEIYALSLAPKETRVIKLNQNIGNREVRGYTDTYSGYVHCHISGWQES